VDRLYHGIRRAARRFGCGIAGGETTSVPPGGGLMISVAMLGSVARRCLTLRSGAAAGDLIMVTGRLGGSLAGHHLDFVPRLAEARWLVARVRPRAMMDLSDGLAADLPRLAAASGVGFRLDAAALPRHRGCSVEQALSDGEDYELLFTLSPAKLPALRKAWPGVFPRVPLTVIGEILADPRQRPALSGGWEHFRS
jgi:thiamine-monophosphate kinase